MDPVTCHMCQGGIPGKEIQTLKNCPSCGADLSALVRRRLAQLAAKNAPPPQGSSFIARAALFSLLAPCFAIVVNLLGRQALSGSHPGMLMLGAVCSLFVAVGFIFAVIAFFAPKGEEKGTMRKAIAGICINGLILCFAILSFFTHQRVAARESKTPPPRKGWSYISGK